MKIFIADHNEFLRLGLTKLLGNLYANILIFGGVSAQVIQNQPDWKQTDLVILQQSNSKKPTGANLIALLSQFSSGLKIMVLEKINEAVSRVLAGKPYLESL